MRLSFSYAATNKPASGTRKRLGRWSDNARRSVAARPGADRDWAVPARARTKRKGIDRSIHPGQTTAGEQKSRIRKRSAREFAKHIRIDSFMSHGKIIGPV